MKPTSIFLPRPVLAASLVVLGLTACGGGDEIFPPPPAPPPVTAVPASAFVSAQTYTQYALTLAPSETAEPLTLPASDAPLSETAEPVAVN